MNAQALTESTHLKHELLSFERNMSPRLSPNGRLIAFVRTVDEGQELWLRSGDGRERQLAAHHGELIVDLRWTADGSLVLYRHAQRGRERWSLSAVLMDALDRVEVPIPGSVTEYWLSQSDPSAVVCGCRTVRSQYPELFRGGLADSACDPVLIASNHGFHQWFVDGNLRPRGGIRLAEGGSAQVILGDNPGAARMVLEIDVEETVDLSVQGFSRDGRYLFLLTSRGARTRRLISIDSESAAISTVFEHPHLDVESYPIAGEGVWFDPRTGTPDICSVMDQRLRYQPLIVDREQAVARLAPVDTHSAVLLDRSADDRTWLIVNVHDNGPIEYRMFDPVAGTSDPVFVNRPQLCGYILPRLEDFFFVARDGRRLSGYAMRPLNRDAPLPTVVMVHGGPAGRDSWRFYAEAHYLAVLGYLTLHINYRGSKGFGIDFRRAGNAEWGGRMQQDLYDAIASGVTAGLVDPDRVAFFGASYGGYASLLAACTRPDLVKCAIAISPTCDLISLVKTPPPYWQPLSLLLRRQILGARDGQQLDERTIESRSPIHVLDRSCAPVLLVTGVRDPRVPVAEVDNFAARAQALDIPIRYLRFEDEGHHVKSNANRQILFTVIEEFLEVHLATK